MPIENVDASCAICGRAPYPTECPHESERLTLALAQAQSRWLQAEGMVRIREWVLNHARNQIILIFTQLKQLRRQQHESYLVRIPCYSMFVQFNGHPPIDPTLIHQIRAQIAAADAKFKEMIDSDWRNACMRYPEVLDYYFGLVRFKLPANDAAEVTQPMFNGAPQMVEERRPRRGSGDTGGHRQRRRSRSRSRSGPPPAPEVPGRRRRRG